MNDPDEDTQSVASSHTVEPQLKRHNATKFDSDDEVIDFEETTVEAHPIPDHTQPRDIRAEIHGISVAKAASQLIGGEFSFCNIASIEQRY
jgi:hypothetical protein